jgi:hypothetical protein
MNWIVRYFNIDSKLIYFYFILDKMEKDITVDAMNNIPEGCENFKIIEITNIYQPKEDSNILFFAENDNGSWIVICLIDGILVSECRSPEFTKKNADKIAKYCATNYQIIKINLFR